MSVQTIALVGGGQASAVAARTLRRRGFTDRIVLIGDEPDRPYQRPPLSKEYLGAGDDSSLYLLPDAWTEVQGVEVRTGVRALKISAADGSVLLDDGTSLAADRVLLATGGRPRRMAGAEGDRIHYLRTRADADALATQLVAGTRLIVVGGGFIGAEVASTARSLGVEVTVLEAGSVPLGRALGSTIGECCGRLSAAAGVDLRVGVEVESVRQKGDEVVVSTSAGPVAGDYVLIGIGMLPNEELARDSGIDVGNGILVDEYCRTSVENVYAAGDVANHYHPLFGVRMRVEHFDNASKQGAAAANNMIGRTTLFDDPHWFWSDQFGANLQFVGRAGAGDQLVTRGDPAGDTWSAFFLGDGSVRAAFAMNDPEAVMVARELITFGVTVTPEQLGDLGTDLTEMVE